MRVMILGANGMIGNGIFNYLITKKDLEVIGTVRSQNNLKYFRDNQYMIVPNINCLDLGRVSSLLQEKTPDIIINCTGITKHLPNANNYIDVLTLNSVFPHQLAELCQEYKSRLIQISTDCVFSGETGNYAEKSPTDSQDLYGKSKALGEVLAKQVLTIRTSTIGYEINTCYGLLEWFLSQKEECFGYTNAIFSGLPVNELAKTIYDYIIFNDSINGLYHIASSPISKFDLLNLLAKQYKKNISIIADDDLVLDRSLDGNLFSLETGYSPIDWSKMIENMYQMGRVSYE